MTADMGIVNHLNKWDSSLCAQFNLFNIFPYTHQQSGLVSYSFNVNFGHVS